MTYSQSVEDEFLQRVASGKLVAQDEYDQIAQDLPPEALAGALARRFDASGETRMLVEAARLFLRAGFYYQALEACSRAPRLPELQRITAQALPYVRADYPDAPMVGKLLDDVFLVIDLATGKMVRFPSLV